jgi:hypothetical protein
MVQPEYVQRHRLVCELRDIDFGGRVGHAGGRGAALIAVPRLRNRLVFPAGTTSAASPGPVPFRSNGEIMRIICELSARFLVSVDHASYFSPHFIDDETSSDDAIGG